MTPSRVPARRRQPLRIMIVDDESMVGKELKPALSGDGDIVETFESGEAALASFDREPYDVVVTDIRMGEVDGLEVLERILARSKQTKVIIMSRYATVEMAREAFSKGAFDMVVKPFSPQYLRDIIERAVEQVSE